MFDNLEGHKVTIWHPYVMKVKTDLKTAYVDRWWHYLGITGYFLVLCARMETLCLFGFDSCLTGDKLRINGSGLKEGDN
jgi:hypothetical protein